ncbi:frigida-LIKE protein, partial [Trifolium medium]|nr:frigida-LIKE protein [Trifolium medium]
MEEFLSKDEEFKSQVKEFESKQEELKSQKKQFENQVESRLKGLESKEKQFKEQMKEFLSKDEEFKGQMKEFESKQEELRSQKKQFENQVEDFKLKEKQFEGRWKELELKENKFKVKASEATETFIRDSKQQFDGSVTNYSVILFLRQNPNLYTTVIHESSRCIASYYLPYHPNPKMISIMPTNEEVAKYNWSLDEYHATKGYCKSRMAVCLSGRAAESFVLGTDYKTNGSEWEATEMADKGWHGTDASADSYPIQKHYKDRGGYS